MNPAIIRRVAAVRAAARQQVPASAAARTYASFPPQEIDPQLNGYPQLPPIPRQRLPALGWDDNLTRRNFGDTLYEHEEVLSMWGPDAPPLPPTVALRQFLYVVAGFVTVGFTIKALTPEPPAVRREYPYGGLVKELGGLDENKARPDSNEN